MPHRQTGQQEQYRDRSEGVHLRGDGSPERRPGERETQPGPSPRPPQQPHRRQHEPGRRYVERGQRAVRDDVRRERVQGERPQPADRTGEFTAEGEHHKTEEQRQYDHRQACPQHQPPGVVAGLVEQMAAHLALVALEVPVEVRAGRGHSGGDDQLAQRRVLGVEAQAVLVEVDGRRADVHGLVDGGCLLDGRGDHRDGHLEEQDGHGERDQQALVVSQQGQQSRASGRG